MRGIFTIEVNDEIYDISPLNLPPNVIQYGVSKYGELQFVIQRNISYKGDHWDLAYPCLNLSTTPGLIHSVVEKIGAHFT